MVQLVITFCLIANSASCIEQRPILEDVASPMGCLIAAQPIAAEFVRGHRTFRFASWRCEIGKRAEKAA
jgi:hypothetical protein